MDIVLLLGMVAFIYALIILPQQRRQRAHRRLLESLEVGDEVVTSSGVYGDITEFDGQTVFLEVSDGVEIKCTLGSISDKVSRPAEVTE